MNQRHRRLLELTLIFLIAAVLLWQVAEVYQRLLLQAQAQALRLQATNFRQSARVAHALWRLQAKPSQQMPYSGDTLMFTPVGWPKDALPRAGGHGDREMTESRCQRLWHALMQSRDLEVKLWRVKGRELSTGICRYRDAATDSHSGYFDYDQINGEVTLVLRAQSPR